MASFSLLFMQLFLIAGILSTKIQRNVSDEFDERKLLKSYTAAALGGLLSGSISLFVIVFMV